MPKLSVQGFHLLKPKSKPQPFNITKHKQYFFNQLSRLTIIYSAHNNVHPTTSPTTSSSTSTSSINPPSQLPQQTEVPVPTSSASNLTSASNPTPDPVPPPTNPLVNPQNVHHKQTWAKSGIVQSRIHPTLLLTHLEPKQLNNLFLTQRGILQYNKSIVYSNIYHFLTTHEVLQA